MWEDIQQPGHPWANCLLVELHLLLACGQSLINWQKHGVQLLLCSYLVSRNPNGHAQKCMSLLPIDGMGCPESWSLGSTGLNLNARVTLHFHHFHTSPWSHTSILLSRNWQAAGLLDTCVTCILKTNLVILSQHVSMVFVSLQSISIDDCIKDHISVLMTVLKITLIDPNLKRKGWSRSVLSHHTTGWKTIIHGLDEARERRWSMVVYKWEIDERVNGEHYSPNLATHCVWCIHHEVLLPNLPSVQYIQVRCCRNICFLNWPIKVPIAQHVLEPSCSLALSLSLAFSELLYHG